MPATFPPEKAPRPEEISVDLTEAGLLVDRTESIARLYAQHLSWSSAKEAWHRERVSARGSRHSAQKIFRVIRGRLQAAGEALPAISELPDVLSECADGQAKAQVVYQYLMEADALARYLVSELFRSGPPWELSREALLGRLSQFRHPSGEALSYAESTQKRWVQGLRATLKEIGVLGGPHETEGAPPMIENTPLRVSAYYSWKKMEKRWQEHPVGWQHLFQTRPHQKILLRRLAGDPSWATKTFQGSSVLVPAST